MKKPITKKEIATLMQQFKTRGGVVKKLPTMTCPNMFEEYQPKKHIQLAGQTRFMYYSTEDK